MENERMTMSKKKIIVQYIMIWFCVILFVLLTVYYFWYFFFLNGFASQYSGAVTSLEKQLIIAAYKDNWASSARYLTDIRFLGMFFLYYVSIIFSFIYCSITNKPIVSMIRISFMIAIAAIAYQLFLRLLFGLADITES